MADILRIDLTTRTTRRESLDPRLVADYIGAKGIGSHLLLEEVPPDVDPLGPQNKLFFTCGPLSGSAMPGTNRYAVYFLSPQTGGYGEAYCGGKLATQFARTGHRMVILEGAASSPVYIEVSDEGVAIHPADDLWGLDTYESEARIIEKTGVRQAQACVIGSGGERLVRFATIQHEHTHSLGRGGAGAVMGAKKVKGLVFHGSTRPAVARPDEFRTLVKEMAGQCKDNGTVNAYHTYGTVQLVKPLNSIGAFPTRYWTKGRLDGWEQLSGDAMVEKYKVGSTTCPPCVIACGHVCRVPDGDLAGLEVDGPEYETIWSFGGLCEIVDFPFIMLCNDICDREGIDTMTAGSLCGLAIEASRRGLIDERLDYGDATGVELFLRRMARREGKTADLFAEGILTVERELGLEGVAVHVKGMDPAAYDPRRTSGMGLGYATSARGACHMRSTFIRAELVGLCDLGELEGKGELYVAWENRLVMMDTMIFCRFYRDMLEWPFLTRIVNAAIGADYTADELDAIANRIVTETHRFNELRGFGPESERLPAWITERPLEGDNGQSYRFTAEDLEYMVRDYYAARGWGQPPA